MAPGAHFWPHRHQRSASAPPRLQMLHATDGAPPWSPEAVRLGYWPAGDFNLKKNIPENRTIHLQMGWVFSIVILHFQDFKGITKVTFFKKSKAYNVFSKAAMILVDSQGFFEQERIPQ